MLSRFDIVKRDVTASVLICHSAGFIGDDASCAINLDQFFRPAIIVAPACLLAEVPITGLSSAPLKKYWSAVCGSASSPPAAFAAFTPASVHGPLWAAANPQNANTASNSRQMRIVILLWRFMFEDGADFRYEHGSFGEGVASRM
jgi:hypothetical protein